MRAMCAEMRRSGDDEESRRRNGGHLDAALHPFSAECQRRFRGRKCWNAVDLNASPFPKAGKQEDELQRPEQQIPLCAARVPRNGTSQRRAAPLGMTGFGLGVATP